MPEKTEIHRLCAGDAHGRAMDQLIKIYNEALPASERKPRSVLEKMLFDGRYFFYVLEEKKQVLAFAIVFSPNELNYCLLEYMAVAQTERNKGLGGALFDYLVEQFSDNTMIMEIDSPEEKSDDHEQRRKRAQFYAAHGSKRVDGLNYILPLKTDDLPPQMLLMAKMANPQSHVDKAVLRAWVSDIYFSVYGCSDDDPRLDQMFSRLPDRIILE